MQENIIIEAVRNFNRFYTRHLGLLNHFFLNNEYSLSQVRILNEITHNQGITSSQLCSRLNMDAGYVSRILKGFEKEQVISKQKSANDARSALICLTEKGKCVFDQLNTKSNYQIQSLTQPLSYPQNKPSWLVWVLSKRY